MVIVSTVMSSSSTLTASLTSRDFFEKVVPEIRANGARNIVELARALRMPVETTRYKVKGMLKRGLDIHACIDYDRFGLSHYYAYLNLTEKARMSEKKLFGILGDQAYLRSSARRLPTNEYACRFAAPTATNSPGTSSLHRLLRGLVEEKLVESFSLYNVSWEKHHTLLPEYFDLKHGTWKIDWAKIAKKEPTSQKDVRSDSANQVHSNFDELDLMIAREMEMDALTRLSDIASALKTTLNNIFYHYHKHVLEGKLIEEFAIRWNGTQNQESIFVQFCFSNLSRVEEKTVRNALRKLPFLWTDALSLETGFYVAEANIPQLCFVDALNFLSATLGASASKLNVSILDAKMRQEHPMQAQLFKDNKWKFDAEDAVQQVVSKLKR